MVGVFGIVQHCLAACEKARKISIFKHLTFLSLSASLYLCLSDSNAVCSYIGFVSFRHFAPPLFVIYMEYVKSHIRPKMSILGYDGIIYVCNDVPYPDFNYISVPIFTFDVCLT